MSDTIPKQVDPQDWVSPNTPVTNAAGNLLTLAAVMDTYPQSLKRFKDNSPTAYKQFEKQVLALFNQQLDGLLEQTQHMYTTTDFKTFPQVEAVPVTAIEQLKEQVNA